MSRAAKEWVWGPPPGGESLGQGRGLTLLEQGPQDAGELQEDSSATAGVHSPVHPAVPVVSVEHIAVWGEEENQKPEKRVGQPGGTGVGGVQSGGSEQGCSWGAHQAPQPLGSSPGRWRSSAAPGGCEYSCSPGWGVQGSHSVGSAPAPPPPPPHSPLLCPGARETGPERNRTGQDHVPRSTRRVSKARAQLF